MASGSSVFIDTAPFIYMLEDNEQYSAKVRTLVNEYYESDTPLFTSPLTICRAKKHGCTATRQRDCFRVRCIPDERQAASASGRNPRASHGRFITRHRHQRLGSADRRSGVRALWADGRGNRVYRKPKTIVDFFANVCYI